MCLSHANGQKAPAWIGIATTVALLLAIASGACKTESAPEAKKEGATPYTTPTPYYPAGTATTDDQVSVAITATGEINGRFTFAPGTQINIPFTLTVTPSSKASYVDAAFSQMPAGGRRDTTGGPQAPRFVWTAPTSGTYQLTLVVRNRVVCQKTEVSNPSVCTLVDGQASTGRTYDQSRTYTIEITGTATGSTLNPTGTTSTSGLGGLLSGGGLGGLLSGGSSSGLLSTLIGLVTSLMNNYGSNDYDVQGTLSSASEDDLVQLAKDLDAAPDRATQKKIAEQFMQSH